MCVGAFAPSRYAPHEFKPWVELQSDEKLAHFAVDIAITIFRPVGTERTGATGNPLALVDSLIGVCGVAWLRVVDATAMLSITSGNTKSSMLKMTEKAARFILGDDRNS